jgi:hypothetical protein
LFANGGHLPTGCHKASGRLILIITSTMWAGYGENSPMLRYRLKKGRGPSTTCDLSRAKDHTSLRMTK